MPLQMIYQEVSSDFINQAFDEHAGVSSNSPGQTTSTSVEYNTSARVLEETLRRSEGVLPSINPEVLVKGEDPQEILERAGLLQENENGFRINLKGEADSDRTPDTSEVQEAMDIYLENTEVDWIPRKPRTGDEFVSAFHDDFGNIYRGVEGQMMYDKDNIEHLYEGTAASDAG